MSRFYGLLCISFTMILHGIITLLIFNKACFFIKVIGHT